MVPWEYRRRAEEETAVLVPSRRFVLPSPSHPRDREEVASPPPWTRQHPSVYVSVQVRTEGGSCLGVCGCVFGGDGRSETFPFSGWVDAHREREDPGWTSGNENEEGRNPGCPLRNTEEAKEPHRQAEDRRNRTHVLDRKRRFDTYTTGKGTAQERPTSDARSVIRHQAFRSNLHHSPHTSQKKKNVNVVPGTTLASVSCTDLDEPMTEACAR